MYAPVVRTTDIFCSLRILVTSLIDLEIVKILNKYPTKPFFETNISGVRMFMSKLSRYCFPRLSQITNISSFLVPNAFNSLIRFRAGSTCPPVPTQKKHTLLFIIS